MVKHKGKSFVELISASRIFVRVSELAVEIEKQYTGEAFCVVAVLDGAFVFAADLIRALSFDTEVVFCKYKSYVGTESSGSLQEILPLGQEIKGKHVLIVEDIVDSGLTVSKIKAKAIELGAKSVQTAALLFKPSNFNFGEVPDFVGFEIEDKFVIGYGMDFDGFGRQLPGIYQLQVKN